MPSVRKSGVMEFVTLPPGERLTLAWPTDARCPGGDWSAYLARTRANPDYGRPGWTRDCGRQFHAGADIAPVRATATGRTMCVMFSDCAKGLEYPSDEPVWSVDEPVYAVCDGRVEEVHAEAATSAFGFHVILRHRWPASARPFFTLYAHLQRIAVRAGETVARGSEIGRMGQTSSSADARNWMAIAPHLHFEALDEEGGPYDPLLFLRAGLPA